MRPLTLGIQCNGPFTTDEFLFRSGLPSVFRARSTYPSIRVARVSFSSASNLRQRRLFSPRDPTSRTGNCAVVQLSRRAPADATVGNKGLAWARRSLSSTRVDRYLFHPFRVRRNRSAFTPREGCTMAGPPEVAALSSFPSLLNVDYLLDS